MLTDHEDIIEVNMNKIKKNIYNLLFLHLFFIEKIFILKFKK